eukprot:gene7740-5429_t
MLFISDDDDNDDTTKGAAATSRDGETRCARNPPLLLHGTPSHISLFIAAVLSPYE